ncbi:MAG: hypothetical protein ACKOQ1_10165, partial [Actinomycetota bacterium]
MRLFRLVSGVGLLLSIVAISSTTTESVVRAASTSYSTAGSYTWSVPAGITSITVTARGGSGQAGVPGQRGAPGKGAI